MTEPNTKPVSPEDKRPLVLLTGATGNIGSRLLPLVEQRNVRVRCLARNPNKLRPQAAESTKIAKGHGGIYEST